MKKVRLFIYIFLVFLWVGLLGGLGKVIRFYWVGIIIMFYGCFG
jgi:hypothetical protein